MNKTVTESLVANERAGGITMDIRNIRVTPRVKDLTEREEAIQPLVRPELAKVAGRENLV